MEHLGLQYRRGTFDDIPALQELGLLAYGQFKGELSAVHWEELRANLSSETLYPALLALGGSFVCAVQDKPVGMAFLVPSGNPNDIYPEDWSYIRLVGVHSGFAGLGIGRALTLKCIEAARLQGERIVGLHTSEMMPAARHIYESLGFLKVKELSSRFGKRYWLYQLPVKSQQ